MIEHDGQIVRVSCQGDIRVTTFRPIDGIVWVVLEQGPEGEPGRPGDRLQPVDLHEIPGVHIGIRDPRSAEALVAQFEHALTYLNEPKLEVVLLESRAKRRAARTYVTGVCLYAPVISSVKPEGAIACCVCRAYGLRKTKISVGSLCWGCGRRLLREPRARVMSDLWEDERGDWSDPPPYPTPVSSG